MSNKIIVSVIVIGILVATGIVLINKNGLESKTGPTIIEKSTKQPIKEFTMQSFVEFVNEQPKPQFSLKEIKVNKGDLVRIKITVTSGMHDFKISDYNVYSATPLNQETIVEFTADKTGEFVYYCTIPGHRQLGQWGTLKVAA